MIGCANIFLTVAPSFITPPLNVSVVSPETAMFSCTADGVPRPDITWWRVNNGTEMEVMEDSFTQITLSDRLTMSVLTFSETQPFRSGVYVCLAANLVDSATAMAELTVNGELLYTVSSPGFGYRHVQYVEKGICGYLVSMKCL